MEVEEVVNQTWALPSVGSFVVIRMTCSPRKKVLRAVGREVREGSVSFLGWERYFQLGASEKASWRR